MDLDDPELDDLLRRMGGDPSFKAKQAWLSNPVIVRLAEAFDIDLQPALQARREFVDNSIGLLRATVRLGEFGWVASAHRLRTPVYAEAADLIEGGGKRGDRRCLDDVSMGREQRRLAR